MPRPENEMQSYRDWPIRDTKPAEIDWVGVPETSDGTMLALHSETDRIIEVEPNLEDQVLERVPGRERELTEGDFGKFVHDLAEEHGWEWLSEFAEGHLQDHRAESD